MATVQFITSPHGISKRFRLKNEPKNSFQGIDDILPPVVKEELQKIESIEVCSCTNDILLKSGNLRDSQNDAFLISVLDRCINTSMEQSAHPLDKIYNESKEKDFLTSKETDYKTVVKPTCNLENGQSTTAFKKSNGICFNTIDHQSGPESARTLLELPHKSLNEDETELSVDSDESAISNVSNESFNNLKEPTRFEQISVEKNANLLTCEDKRTNEFLKNDKLKSIHQEECNRHVRISEEFPKGEFQHNGRICLEESNKNILCLNSNGKTSDSLKMHKLGHILEDTSKGCNYRESPVNIAKNLEESKLDDVKIVEGSKLENKSSLKKSKPKSKLHSHDYEKFSKVIQKARNKVKPRTKLSQPSTSAKEENAQLRQNLHALKLECSKMGRSNDYKAELTTILYDMEEMEEFLSFCGDELTQMLSHFSAVSGILRFLSSAAEHIEIDLENAQCYKVMFADKNRKSTDEYFRIAAGTYSEIQKLGHSLLTKIIEQGKTWRHALDIYKENLDTLADTTWKFCSGSIEDQLFDDRDFVYAAFEELRTQVFPAQMIQKQVQDLHNTELPKICDIREQVDQLKSLSSKLPHLIGKCSL